jgi:uncharacterized protein (DUF4415 family)
MREAAAGGKAGCPNRLMPRSLCRFGTGRPRLLSYNVSMSRRPSDPRSAAERAFKAVTAPKPVEVPAAKPALPGVKETVSLRIDRDVLDHFQADGPGWQDRINAALRKAAGL